MKTKSLNQVLALFVSLALMLVMVPVCAFGADEDAMPIPSGHSNEFFVTQAESIEIYNQLLDSFKATNYSDIGETNLIYPDYYGGAYIDNETGELIIKIVESTDEIKEEVYNLIDGEVLFQNCEVSYNQLVTAHELISNNWDWFEENGVHITGIARNVSNGIVKVFIEDLTSEKVNTVRGICNVDFLAFENAPVEKNLDCKNEDKETGVIPYAAGDRVPGNIGYCTTSDSTLSFLASIRGKIVCVIAGHAVESVGQEFYLFKYGSAANKGIVKETAYYNGSTADAAYVERANGQHFEGENVLPNGGVIWSASTYSYPEGTTVYAYGMKSGLTSGKITDESYDMQSGSIRIKDLTIASYSSDKGDSGGPVMIYEGNYGSASRYVLIGTQKAYRSVPPAEAYFSKYSNIVDILGVKFLAP